MQQEETKDHSKSGNTLNSDVGNLRGTKHTTGKGTIQAGLKFTLFIAIFLKNMH